MLQFAADTDISKNENHCRYEILNDEDAKRKGDTCLLHMQVLDAAVKEHDSGTEFKPSQLVESNERACE